MLFWLKINGAIQGPLSKDEVTRLLSDLPLDVMVSSNQIKWDPLGEHKACFLGTSVDAAVPPILPQELTQKPPALAGPRKPYSRWSHASFFLRRYWWIGLIGLLGWKFCLLAVVLLGLGLLVPSPVQYFHEPSIPRPKLGPVTVPFAEPPNMLGQSDCLLTLSPRFDRLGFHPHYSKTLPENIAYWKQQQYTRFEALLTAYNAIQAEVMECHAAWDKRCWFTHLYDCYWDDRKALAFGRVKEIDRGADMLQRLCETPHGKGLVGELEVIAELAKLPEEFLIVNGFTCQLLLTREVDGKRRRSAQIDHLVIGPYGVVVIETKNWSETFHRRGEYFHPFEQVTSAAKIFQIQFDLLSTPAAIVVSHRRFKHPTLHVQQCKANELRNMVMTQANGWLSKDTTDRLKGWFMERLTR